MKSFVTTSEGVRIPQTGSKSQKWPSLHSREILRSLLRSLTI